MSTGTLLTDSFATAFIYPVLSLGQLAEQSTGHQVENPTDGNVLAVFVSTFYVEIECQLICVGHAGLESGPLNCVTAAPATTDWRASGIKVGTKVRVFNGAIRVGNLLQFPLSDCEHWRSAKRALPLAKKLGLGVTSFRQVTDRYAESGEPYLDGLGYFLKAATASPVHRHVAMAAKNPLTDARQWLEQALAQPRAVPQELAAWTEKLCGLGSGLTPSGDDFLSGILIALNFLNEVELKDCLWRQIEDCARHHTTPISLAHLSAAAQGLEGATIHHVMSAIANGSDEQISRAVNDLPLVGQSSGWDIMAGIITTFEAWLFVIDDPQIAFQAALELRAASR